MKKIIFSLILILSFCSQSLAGTSVWKVQKGDSVVYLGGTCHLLRQSDFPLPKEFMKAYKESELVVFETDIKKLSDPSTQQIMMAKSMYTDGSTIDKHLSPNVYKKLSKYCASSGIPLESLKIFKPPIVLITITVTELSKLGVTQEGVDMYFYKLATSDKKAVEGFETVDDHINFMLEIGQGDEDALVTHSLNDMKTIKQQYETIIKAWRTGNEKTLNKIMLGDFKPKYPKLYKRLVADRNENWMPMIEAYFKTPQKEFILVGALHLVGPDGIIKALRKKGYKVAKL